MDAKLEITHEEAVRRWKGLKQQKKEMTERLKEFIRKDYLERYGKEPESIEVW